MQGGVVWLDVSDLLLWRRAEVSGIQRVLAEVVAETVRRPPAGVTVRLLALQAAGGPRPLTAAEVMPRVAALLQRPWPPPAMPARLTWPHRVARWLLHRLPESLRPPVRNRVYGWLAARRRRLRRRGGPRPDRPARPPAMAGPRAGDTLLNLGTPWSHHPHYLARLAQEKQRLGLRYAQLVYDVGPAWRGEEAGMPRLFTDWLRAMLPLADQLVTISRYSDEDLRRLAARQVLALPPLRRVRLGAGLPRVQLPPRRAELAPLLRRGGYLLTVASLSPSKNHAAIVQALALLAARGRALPPLLWLGRNIQRAELDALLARHPAVARQVLHLEGADDHDLALAYAHCRLTIFPSRFEGYGLPVAESLAFGKVCLASNACSIPEAGGDFADYFAPDDPAALAALIERYLDEAALAAREAEIRRGHRPTTWQETCRQLYAALGPS